MSWVPWIELAAFAAATWLCALLLTRMVQRHAELSGVLDVPNSRSSHTRPTPRGGGLAIVVACTGAFIAAFLVGLMPIDVLIANLGSLAVAAIGYRDDRRPVSAMLRLLVHVAAAAWAIHFLGGLPPIQIGETVVGFGRFAPLLGLLGFIWVLNLFNFMDGIDGIAASESAFIGIAGGALALASPGGVGPGIVAMTFGAASLGFLVFNWAPARIFMGDVGSGFLGFVIVLLAIWTASSDPVALLVWLILGAVFFVDATITLLRRASRRERVFEAHRSHAYQWMARRWRSHSRVTASIIAIDLLWLLPWAATARFRPALAGWCTLAAISPLVFIALLAGSGRAESAAKDTTHKG